jgi:signal transduction histidine kinase
MQGSFEEFAIDVIKANGQPLQMIANAKERRDAQDKPLSISLALIRATDRRRYEQELLGTRELAKAAGQIAEERLQREHEAHELREQFIAVLGHDLRNPLASISAGARILDRTAQTEKEHQVIAMMQTTVMRMMSLVGLRLIKISATSLDYGASDIVFSIVAPVDGRPAAPGNGVHVAFQAPDRETVRRFHQTAMAQGGTDEGAPDIREKYNANYYGAFVRDPDGNKIEAVTYTAGESFGLPPRE